MGGTYSEPVPNHVDSGGIVCMVLRSYDKLRLLHAPTEVLNMVTKIVRDLSHDETIVGEDKHGSIQFRLPGSPFVLNAGKDSATIGKLFGIRVFEEMNTMGYDLITSADLSRAYDQSSWFFKKGAGERPRQPVMCIAPGATDKLVLMRSCDYVVSAVRACIQENWALGLQNEKVEETGIERLHEFKLRGHPWFGEGEESTLCRKLLMGLIGALGSLHWRLLAATNLKGGTDSLFFIYDEDHNLSGNDLAMLSLNRHDRIRLLNFDQAVCNSVRTAILRFYQTKEPEERNYHGAIEYKVKGYPFASSGNEAIAARQLICRVMEALRDHGWDCLTTIDISRKMTDKSVFLFRRCESAQLKFACLALSDVDRIRLVNFPPQVAKTMRDLIEASYMPGISEEYSKDASCHEINLHGVPWTQNTSYNLHARSMLLRILKEAGQNGWKLSASADVSAKYVHQENGPDYPIDVHSWFFCFQGIQRRKMSPGATTPVISPAISYAELKVSDLEANAPPTYEQALSVNK